MRDQFQMESILFKTLCTLSDVLLADPRSRQPAGHHRCGTDTVVGGHRHVIQDVEAMRPIGGFEVMIKSFVPFLSSANHVRRHSRSPLLLFNYVREVQEIGAVGQILETVAALTGLGFVACD